MCINNPGHMTKVTTMLIYEYGKILQTVSLELVGPFQGNLPCRCVGRRFMILNKI